MKGGKLVYVIKIIAYILVIIGALNWGLVGFLGLDLVAKLFGDMSVLSRTVYAIVGISAIILLIANRDIFYYPDI